jgi:hypothetical protein
MQRPHNLWDAGYSCSEDKIMLDLAALSPDSTAPHAQPRRREFPTIAKVFVVATLLALACCTKKSVAQNSPADLRLDVKTPFQFVVYGDTRFHDPADLEPANPAVRIALVKAIADVNPAFICFTGDIVYNGYDANDWKVWDTETAMWRK